MNLGKGLTAGIAETRTDGRRLMSGATIKISVDRLPDAPEPTLPCRDQEEKISSFAMSWSEEQHRKRVDASERQKKWRRKCGQA